MPIHKHPEGRVTSLAIQTAICTCAITMINLCLLVTLPHVALDPQSMEVAKHDWAFSTEL